MGKKILVVDDHPVALKLMTGFLEKEGHLVYTATDGFEALGILKTMTPDIVFMDIIMPKISGDVLCKAMRKIPGLVNCYIVIISAVVVEQEFDLSQIEADACIAKGPFDGMIPHIRQVIVQAGQRRGQQDPRTVLGLDGIHPRRITNELLSQNLHLKIILESMSEGILELYRHKIIYANSAAVSLLGVPHEQLLGVYLPDIINPDIRSVVTALLVSNRATHLEIGEADPIEIRGRQLTMRKQHVTGESDCDIILLKDITERKRMESIAEAANLMDNIGYIFSGIRHEIGNPLNSIKMALTVLKKNLVTYSRETIAEFVERASMEVVRIEYLLKALKNFSLFESPQVQNFRLDQFMEQFISLIIKDFEGQGIHIKTTVSPDIKWAAADARALHQVLLNILTNAADALADQEAPRIVIDISKHHQWINMKINDNGCGIAEEDQEKLFKPFFTSKQHGSGLGLVIVKKMLAKMNCSIRIDSQQNTGTEVTISVPEGLADGDSAQ